MHALSKPPCRRPARPPARPPQESQQKRDKRLAELRTELVQRGRATADIDRMLSIAPVGAITCEYCCAACVAGRS